MALDTLFVVSTLKDVVANHREPGSNSGQVRTNPNSPEFVNQSARKVDVDFTVGSVLLINLCVAVRPDDTGGVRRSSRYIKPNCSISR